MARHVRILMILMLAAFAAGTAVHGANASIMNVEMAFAAMDSADMGDCQACPDGDDVTASCDSLCLSPVLAVVPSPDADLPEGKPVTTSTLARGVTGRTGLPDPYPPRSIILD